MSLNNGAIGAPESRRIARRRVWVSFGAALSCLLCFIVLAAFLVAAGGDDRLDRVVSSAVQSWRNPLLDQIMVAATYLCSWQVVVTGAVLSAIYLVVLRHWLELVALAVSIAGNSVIVSGLKSALPRVRPDQLKALLPATGSSFPSGHTFSAFALYGLLAVFWAASLQRSRSRLLLYAAAAMFVLLVGTSRVYVGAHWPSDVLGSCFLGIAWLTVVAVGLGRFAASHPEAEATQAAASRLMPAGALALLALWVVAVITIAHFDPAAIRSGAIAERSELPLPAGIALPLQDAA